MVRLFRSILQSTFLTLFVFAVFASVCRAQENSAVASRLLDTMDASAFRKMLGGPKRVLVVTVTKGFRHGDSIPLIEKTVEEMGKQTGAWTTDFVRTEAEMQTKMTARALQDVDLVFFGSTTGDLPLPDRDAFLAWIKRGNAFAGVHAATDTFHSWPAYIDMIGAEFQTHGKQVWVIEAVDDKNHAATKSLGAGRQAFDEIYEFKNFDPATFHSLAHMDRHPQTGAPGYFPVSWCKPYGAGRVFYTALGHRPELWAQPWYKQHVQNGILWALGLAPGSDALASASNGASAPTE